MKTIKRNPFSMNCRWCSFYVIPCKTSTFMLSHSKHPLLCYPIKTSKPPNLCIDAICQIQSQRCVRVWNKTQGKQSSMWSSSVNVFFDKYFFYIWQIFDEVLNRVEQSHWLRLRSIKTDCHRVPRTKSVVRKFILKSALRCHRKQRTEFWYLLKKGSSIDKDKITL